MEEHVIKQNRNHFRTILFYILMTFPFYQVDSLVDNISWMGKAYTACQILAGIVIIYLLRKEGMLRKISPLFLFFGGLFLVMCIASALNGGNLKRAAEYGFATIVICLINEYGLMKDIRHFLQAEILFFGTLTVLNLLSVLIWKEGMYLYLDAFKDTWFLGYKSGHIAYQLAFLFYTVMYVLRLKKNRMPWMLAGTLLVFVSTLLVGNSTAAVALVPLLIAALIPGILRHTGILNIVTYAVAGIALELIFVIFRVQDIFSWLIVGILHKRIDLTSRVFIWDKAMEAIRNHPVIGHGYQDFVYSATAVTTHNEILEVLFKSGFLGLFFFLGALALAVYTLYRNRKLQNAQWTSLFLGIFFLMFIVEQYAFAFFFYLLIFGYRCLGINDSGESREDL